MDSVFWTDLSAEQKLKLEPIAHSLVNFDLGTAPGVLIEADDLPEVIRLMDVSVESKTATSYEGITRIVFQRNPNVDVEGGHRISAERLADLKEGIVQSIARVLVPVVNSNVILHYQQSVRVTPEDPNFHIQVWNVPQNNVGNIAKRAPPAIWSIPLVDAASQYVRNPSGEGFPIRDDLSRCVVAELHGRNDLHVHLDLLGGTLSQSQIFHQILQNSVALLLKPEQITDHFKRLFVEECSKSAVRVLATSNANPDRKELIKQLRKQLSECTRLGLNDERKLLRGELLSLDTVADEYDGLLQIPKVKDVRVEGQSIVVFTEVLNCRDNRTGYLHEIGAFKIELPFAGNSPIWTNLTRRVKGFKENQHAPHIWAGGDACLGNAAHIFPDLFTNRQFAVAAQIAIEFVESANTNDPAGKHISSWPLARR